MVEGGRFFGRGAILASLLAASLAQAACGAGDGGGEPASSDSAAEELARRRSQSHDEERVREQRRRERPVRPNAPGPALPPDERPIGGGELVSLSAIQVPRPAGGDIVNQDAAIMLGKAFFWETQVGSDGQVACATCHFNAGTDNRRMNTLHPGEDGLFDSGGVSAAGQLFDGSAIASDDRVGAQGVVGGTFVSLDPTSSAELCDPDETAPFFQSRRVTDRNSPSVIGAVFNRLNFWDGRANDVFNGADPFGRTGNEGEPIGAPIAGASLASQAVGPPLNSAEMSCAGRAFNGPNSIAEKLLDARILGQQKVHPKDGVLGRFSAYPYEGLDCGKGPCTYRQLMLVAFGPQSAPRLREDFSRYWGQAIQAYEATLIPDRTRFDRFLPPIGDQNAMTDQEKLGFAVFVGKGGCAFCHAGPELTDASVGFAIRNGTTSPFGLDTGFHNIGVRPPAEDLGRGRVGPNGIPFSESGSFGDLGGFKTPGLRNLKLTSPYFHNGGKETIEEVVDFYDRGGDFFTFALRPLGLTDEEKAGLVAFMRDALTDCRVEMRRAPFDHPSIEIPNGPSLPAVGADGIGPCP